jgi:hypothetical protein
LIPAQVDCSWPGEKNCECWYLLRMTEGSLKVYQDKQEKSIPVPKGLIIETPFDLRGGRRLAIFYKDGVVVKIVTMYDIDGR